MPETEIPPVLRGDIYFDDVKLQFVGEAEKTRIAFSSGEGGPPKVVDEEVAL